MSLRLHLQRFDLAARARVLSIGEPSARARAVRQWTALDPALSTTWAHRARACQRARTRSARRGLLRLRLSMIAILVDTLKGPQPRGLHCCQWTRRTVIDFDRGARLLDRVNSFDALAPLQRLGEERSAGRCMHLQRANCRSRSFGGSVRSSGCSATRETTGRERSLQGTRRAVRPQERPPRRAESGGEARKKCGHSLCRVSSHRILRNGRYRL